MELAVLTGIPGAGKSTFCAKHLKETHEHVSLDNWRGKKNRRRREETRIREALQAGRNVVVDNTNPTAAERARYAAMARELGAELVAYYFPVDRNGCLARNRRRADKKVVPDSGFFVILGKLQPPSRAEGFREIYIVKVAENGGFSVEHAPDRG
ncbi:MAG: AAA family ATPase [Acidobacteriota bacterium]